MVAGTASKLTSQSISRQQREHTGDGTSLLKPQSSPSSLILPPSRPHLLILPKQFHQVGNTYPNIQAYGSHSHSNHYCISIHQLVGQYCRMVGAALLEIRLFHSQKESPSNAEFSASSLFYHFNIDVLKKINVYILNFYYFACVCIVCMCACLSVCVYVCVCVHMLTPRVDTGCPL